MMNRHPVNPESIASESINPASINPKIRNQHVINSQLANLTTEQRIAHLASLGFSGSYLPDDVVFLLRKLNLKPVDNVEKERLIQSGQRHYSEMIGTENPPSDTHLALYRQALAQGDQRFATETLKLANALMARHAQPIILVSLVRAGVPLGVCLKRAISAAGRLCYHYGISIIRDRGIDRAALEAIIQTHGATGIVFVDGWTGKGAISRELNHNIIPDQRFQLDQPDMAPLVTLADVGGCAWLAASADDWLIPSGILGSVISGLISRSILQQDIPPEQAINDCFNPQNWHGCIEYSHLAAQDLSREFVDHITAICQTLQVDQVAHWPIAIRQQQNQQILAVIERIKDTQQISNENRIKTGIAEATRAVLRRVPDMILLQEAAHPDTVLLRHLAAQTGTTVSVAGSSIAPYHAITLIKRLGE